MVYSSFLTNKLFLTIGIFVLSQSCLLAQEQCSAPAHQLQLSHLTTSTNAYFSFAQGLNNWKLALPLITHASSEVAPPPLFSNFQSTQSTLPAYNVDHLAFFCRLEVHLEKATKIPVRFRLGDVQQVDYLVGKFTGWRYGY